MKKVHRYAKIKTILKYILNFDGNNSLYKWHTYNIFRRGLYRAIENCPGFIDSGVLEYLNGILEIRERDSEALNKIKDLAQKAMSEIEWEERSGNDLYPCIEID